MKHIQPWWVKCLVLAVAAFVMALAMAFPLLEKLGVSLSLATRIQLAAPFSFLVFVVAFVHNPAFWMRRLVQLIAFTWLGSVAASSVHFSAWLEQLFQLRVSKDGPGPFFHVAAALLIGLAFILDYLERQRAEYGQVADNTRPLEQVRPDGAATRSSGHPISEGAATQPVVEPGETRHATTQERPSSSSPGAESGGGIFNSLRGWLSSVVDSPFAKSWLTETKDWAVIALALIAFVVGLKQGVLSERNQHPDTCPHSHSFANERVWRAYPVGTRFDYTEKQDAKRLVGTSIVESSTTIRSRYTIRGLETSGVTLIREELTVPDSAEGSVIRSQELKAQCGTLVFQRRTDVAFGCYTPVPELIKTPAGIYKCAVFHAHPVEQGFEWSGYRLWLTEQVPLPVSAELRQALPDGSLDTTNIQLVRIHSPQ